MPMFGSQWLANAGASYEIDQSIRFNDDDSAYLSRTSGSADSERKLASTSIWLKRSNLTARHTIYSVNPAGSTGAANQITMVFENSGSNGDCITYDNGAVNRQSTSVYRDVSAWYHLCQIFDTTEATAADRVKTYINGTLLTDINIGQDFSLNSNTAFGQNGVVHYLGRGGSTQYFDGYMAEIIFTVGQSVTVANFGETNDDGVWIPKKYTGAFGTNGFFIDGRDSSDLGDDESGNGNDFTSSGLAANDQVPDTPTLNFSTLNAVSNGGNITLQDGNLLAVGVGDWDSVFATISMGKTGKWYFETRMDVETGSNGFISAIHETKDQSRVWSNYIGNTTATYGLGYSLYTSGSGYYTNGSATSITGYSSAPAAGAIIMCAVDLDNNKIWWGLNGTWFNSGDPAGGSGESAAIQANTDYTFGVSTSASEDYFVNFGADSTFGGDTAAGGNSDGGGIGDFKYAVPSGFLCLCTSNLPTPTISDGSKYFQTTLYTGNGTAIGSGGLAVSQSENSTFQPDFVWIKGRSGATEHVLTDAVRGVTKELSSNDTGAEETVTEGLTTFGSAGFTVGSDGSYNTNTATYAAWQWLAGNSTASNEDGSINTTATSVNTAAGISISTYTGTGSNATFGHGLGAVPKMMIAKKLNSATHWVVYHQDLTNASYWVALNLTNAQGVEATHWNSTAPTSTVVNLGTNSNTNGSSAPYILYAFAEVEGFSKFGSFKGNNSLDGPFIHTGFKPAFVMAKRSDSTSNWFILDDQRPAYNVIGGGGVGQLPANLTYAESSLSTYAIADFLSNGFKVRHNMTYGYWNVSGGTYIYMAFAENPFGGDGVAPATAR